MMLQLNLGANTNLKPAKSNSDVLINDVNNPFTQKDIERITNLKVYDDNLGDLSDYIILYEDEYSGNENKEGFFKQTYKLLINDFDISYVLTIYNVNFNKYDKIETFYIKTLENNYLSNDEIIKSIKDHFNYRIYNYEILSTNYFKDVKTGTYEMSIIIRTTNNDKINIIVVLEVLKPDTNYTILVGIIVGTLILVTLVTSTFIKRKKGKKK